MEKVYEQKLDLYYVSIICYMVALVAYAVVAGSLIDEHFSLVWKDPIVYLLALSVLVSIIALIVALVLNKQVVIRDDELEFNTRFKKHSIRPDEIEWVAFTRGSRGKVRQGEAARAARIKLKSLRRRLWFRPALFEQSEDMMQELREWFRRHDIPIRRRRTGSARTGR